MVRQQVNSAMIRAWAFDPTRKVLELEFMNGRIYQYSGFPTFLAKGFELAPSKGEFFLTRIDDRYEAAEVHRQTDRPQPNER